ncbi:hypothetical protein ACFL2F_05150 [Myxococcota bacterium]
MKRFPAQAALILSLWLTGSGCGESIDGRLNINLVPFCEPSLEQIQDEIAAYCIGISLPGVAEPPQNCSGTLEGVTLKVDETSEPVVVVVEGLDSTGKPVVRGRSVPVTLESGEDNVLSIPIAMVDRFALVAGDDGGCQPLPYIAADHAATVFPSGHVLITGSSSRDADSSKVAFLADPVSGRTRLLSTPFSLHRAYHSAVLLEDGRVVVLGGGNPLGVAPREILVVTGPGSLMNDYSFSSFDPTAPPSVSFDVLEGRLLHTRAVHDTALFFGSQIIINDGGSTAEMFLGQVEDSGYVGIGGVDDPFPTSNQFVVTTVVPLDESRAVLLGGEPNHSGLLAVRHDSREVDFQPYNLPVIRRNKPLGVRLHDGRVMFLGGKEGAALPESPVLLLDPAVPMLTEIFVDSRTFPQRGYTATLLDDGRVFVAGGTSTDGNYWPTSTFTLEQDHGDPNRWFAIPGPELILPRSNHTTSLLPDGRLLVVGGLSSRADVTHEEVATSAEIVAF